MIEIREGRGRPVTPLKSKIIYRLKMEKDELEEPYNKLRRQWIRSRQILRSLTPEAGEVYKFYQEKVQEVESKFVKKVELWPDVRNKTGKVKRRPRQLPAPIEKPPINFQMTF